jgi:hypothetical protein
LLRTLLNDLLLAKEKTGDKRTSAAFFNITFLVSLQEEEAQSGELVVAVAGLVEVDPAEELD